MHEARAGGGVAIALGIAAILSLASPLLLAQATPAPSNAKPFWPTAGDQWIYEVREPTYPRRNYQLSVVVTEVTESVIRDVSSAPDVAPISRDHTVIPQLVGVRPGLATFLPYARAFQGLQADDRLQAVEYQYLWACSSSTEIVCSADARVVGRERVAVRAGSYDAWKIVVSLHMLAYSGGLNSEFVFWYADDVNRVVKYQSRFPPNNFRHLWPIPDIDMELLSYRPAAAN